MVLHIDDLKISHIGPAVLSQAILIIEEEFGSVTPITKHWRKTHKYLWMKLDCTEEGKVPIKMFDYVSKIVESALESIGGELLTSVAGHLFEMNNVDAVLNKVAILLFCGSRLGLTLPRPPRLASFLEPC